MVESYRKDKRRVLACAALCEGEYGLDGIFLGVPALISAQGVEKIFEISLTDDEKAMLIKTAAGVRKTVEECKIRQEIGSGFLPGTLIRVSRRNWRRTGRLRFGASGGTSCLSTDVSPGDRRWTPLPAPGEGGGPFQSEGPRGSNPAFTGHLLSS